MWRVGRNISQPMRESGVEGGGYQSTYEREREQEKGRRISVNL